MKKHAWWIVFWLGEAIIFYGLWKNKQLFCWIVFAVWLALLFRKSWREAS